MAKSVLISPLAERDLLLIWDHISEDNLDAAGEVVDRLMVAIKRLGDNPHLGMRRDDLVPGVRGLVVGKHIIFYTVADDVNIARVLHGARDLPEVLGE